jgi:hypothetical protein
MAPPAQSRNSRAVEPGTIARSADAAPTSTSSIDPLQIECNNALHRFGGDPLARLGGILH